MLAHVERGARNLIQQLGLSQDLPFLERAWECELGGLADQARIVAVDRDTLVVEVDSAPAMQELSLRRKELIRRINRHFSSPIIKCLNLRIV